MADRLAALYERYPHASALWGIRVLGDGTAEVLDPDRMDDRSDRLTVPSSAAGYYLLTLLAGNRHRQYEHCLRAMASVRDGDDRQAIALLRRAMAGWDRHGREREQAGRPGLPDGAYEG